MAHHNNDLFSIKILIIYGITFSLGFWISTIILPFIKTSNLFVIYLLTGLCLELSARICQMFLYNNPKIILDKWFVLWVLIHSVVVYGVVYLIQKINISNEYGFIIAVGFGIAIITHIIWRFMYKKKDPGFDIGNMSPLLRLFIILIFLYFAYSYYIHNVINAFLTTVIQLPLIYKVVEGYIYWIIVIVICAVIWKLFDLFE